MTGTTEAPAVLPFETLQPSPEALEWAARMSGEYAVGRETPGEGNWYRATINLELVEQILRRLHTPGLSELVEELDQIFHDSTREHALAEFRWRPRLTREQEFTDLIAQRTHTQTLRLRLYIWARLNSRYRRRAELGASYDQELHYSNLYEDTATSLSKSGLSWDSATLSLYLHTVSLRLLEYDDLVRTCEQVNNTVLEPCVEQLRELRARMHADMTPRWYRRIPALGGNHVKTLQFLQRLDIPLAVDHYFVEGDVFGDHLRERAPDLFGPPGLAELFLHCLTPPGTKPNREWRRQLDQRLASVTDAAETTRRLLELSLSVPRAEGGGSEHQPPHYRPHVHDILTGLVWAIDVLPVKSTPWAVPLLERIAAFTGTGPGGSKLLRSERMASASVRVLAARGGDETIAALARVRSKIKKKTLLRTVDKALDGIADQLGITSEELLERTVPTFGLNRDGQRTDRVGEHQVTLSLGTDGTAALGFVSAKGRPVASPPKSLRESHPEELKALRAELKELREVVAAERIRLEGFLAQGRVWDAEPWVRHYLEHPVVGTLARRLLWELSINGGTTWVTGLPERDGEHWRLCDEEGITVARPEDAEGVRVRLWHPVRHEPAEVRRWRAHLTGRELSQPFKQAYREIYLLTPAEEKTRTYSNRFAAHILKYGQAKALLTTRGWTTPLLGGFDGGEDANAAGSYTDTESGTVWKATLAVALPDFDHIDDEGRALICATDQVRLHREGQREPTPLAEVPALVLSEAMRDVDLAVGVASIAADPEWVDRGESAHLGYWREAGFGELNESAEMRREALERLVPRLRIADRLSVEGRFLRVRGDLRTYRIHLGSANILMEPDDSYLCVVASGKKGPGVFLPFEEGGGRLSVILSKAFLLARDTAITDPTITGQIRRGLG